MVKQILNKNWRMRRTGEPDQPAVVPGTVYTDLLRNGNMEDPFWRDNEIRALPLMEDDYEFLLTVKYGNDVDVQKLYGTRIRNGMLAIFVVVFAWIV